MAMSSSKYDFQELLEKVDINCHYKNIKQFSTKSSIASLNAFYLGLQEEIDNINSEITPPKEKPTIADYADSFKVFDVYPANLVKPRKPTNKELTRMNSSISRTCPPNATDVTQVEDSPINFPKVNRNNWKSGSEVYLDFFKFEQKLKQMEQKLQTQLLEAEYKSKLKQINIFAQQLEKLLDFKTILGPALSSIEELKLKEIKKDIDEFDFLQKNQVLFNTLNKSVENMCMRLDCLIEMISYAFISISCFNVY